MSEAVQIALIIAVAPTIVALSGAILGFLNRQGIGTIHKIVNSQRDGMEATIKELREEIHEMKRTAAVLQERAAERGVDLPRP